MRRNPALFFSNDVGYGVAGDAQVAIPVLMYSPLILKSPYRAQCTTGVADLHCGSCGQSDLTFRLVFLTSTCPTDTVSLMLEG